MRPTVRKFSLEFHGFRTCSFSQTLVVHSVDSSSLSAQSAQGRDSKGGQEILRCTVSLGFVIFVQRFSYLRERERARERNIYQDIYLEREKEAPFDPGSGCDSLGGFWPS